MRRVDAALNELLRAAAFKLAYGLVLLLCTLSAGLIVLSSWIA